MGPKKATKSVRRIEVHIDPPTEFELGDIATDIQRRREEREQRKGEEAEKQQREEREDARKAKTPRLQKDLAVSTKRPRIERSKSEIDIEGGEEASTSTECQSRCKKKKKK